MKLVVGFGMTDAGDERKIDPGVTRSATTRHANQRGPAQHTTVRHEANRPHRSLCQTARSFCYPPFPVWTGNLRDANLGRAMRADPFGQTPTAPTSTTAGKSSRGSASAIPCRDAPSSFFQSSACKNTVPPSLIVSCHMAS